MSDWLFATPQTVAHQAPLSMGFSRQEYWSGLPCPPPGDLPDPRMEPVSLMSPASAGRFITTSATRLYSKHSAAAAAKSLQSCPTLCDLIDSSPPGSAIPGIQARTLEWDCHFLLQCMKVKSESEIAQLCPTPSDPMDCSPPGSSVHGSFQARVLEWGARAVYVYDLYVLIH